MLIILYPTDTLVAIALDGSRHRVARIWHVSVK